MKRISCILLAMLVMASCLAIGQEKDDAPLVTKLKASPAISTPADKPAKAGRIRRGLTLRQARELGITVRSVADTYKALEESGAIDDESSEAEVVAAVAMELQTANSTAFAAADGETATLDWMAILELILMFLKMLGII